MLWILVIVLSAGCFALAFYVQQRRKSKLIDAGQIIDRKNDFTNKAEEFTLTVSDKSQVTSGVKSLPYSDMNVSMKGDGEKQTFFFNGGTFEARLWLKSEENGKVVYEFNFTHWMEPNNLSTVDGFYNMNKLLTAVERMFLQIDGNTQVKAWYVDTKSKISWI